MSQALSRRLAGRPLLDFLGYTLRGVVTFIDFLNTNVTSVHQTGKQLMVTFDGNQTATYTLSDQQANTEFQLQNLILVQIVGVGHPQQEVAGHPV